MTKKSDPKVVIGYARVSTEDQARNGYSLAAQRKCIEAYCKAHGLALLRIEVDEGVSGKSLRRPAWSRAQEVLRCKEAGGVVFLKLDRLSRSARDVAKLVILSEKGGWALHSIREHLDTSNAMGRFVVQLFAGLAELEREQVSERTSMGLLQARREGRRVSGHAPYGYLHDSGGRVLPDPEEQHNLKYMRRNESRGCSWIARRLNAQRRWNRVGNRWSRQGVDQVLKTAARRESA